MKILVVGGAGYIGSHMVKVLAIAGHEVVTLDNLSQGHRAAVLYGDFVHGDMADRKLVDDLLSSGQFDAVMHFASSIQVGESVINPAKYYHNNVVNTLNLLDSMLQHGVSYFIFSSTAAIFGEPEYTPIDEVHLAAPINPYGRSKWIIEQMLADYDKAYGLKSVCLRYFNAAGADPEGELGERHDPETHLIPLVLQVASGRRNSIDIFGDDYPTRDGTCVRDYIHVMDLCDAHLLALQDMCNKNESARYNLGNGNGFTVQEVIDSVQRVTGRKVVVNKSSRREGDPAILVADSGAAKRAFCWQPQYAELDSIVAHAWVWEKNLLSR